MDQQMKVAGALQSLNKLASETKEKSKCASQLSIPTADEQSIHKDYKPHHWIRSKAIIDPTGHLSIYSPRQLNKAQQRSQSRL